MPAFTLNALLLFALLMPLANAVSAQSDYAALPEMGDHATTVLSEELSLEIGRSMMSQIQHSGKLNNDPIIQDYIQRLGRTLAAGGMVGDQHFSFFVINENSINAFAMPGGYIGVHSGLILASQSESELAAVMAHEIAHVTQHHIARSVEKAQQMNLPLTAAVIAAILLGATDPELANAALAASIGAGQQMQIDFTRANEKEADRVGMQLLASAGFDPRGMADFFLRLQQDSRFASDGVPEFLRTHPISSERMAEAQERANRYPRVMGEDSLTYQLVRARLMLQHSRSLDNLAQQLQEKDERIRLSEAARSYLLALIAQQRHDFSRARDGFTALLKAAPQTIAYIDALARLELAAGQPAQAEKLYRQGLEYYPGNVYLTLGRSNSLMAAGQFAEARELLQQFIKQQGASPETLRQLARAEAELGNLAASHLALAEHYLLLGEPHGALEQLNIARRQRPLDDYHAARIEAYSEQIQRQLQKKQQGQRHQQNN